MPRDLTGFPPAIVPLSELLPPDIYTDRVREVFPDVAPAIYPCGVNLLVQLAIPKAHFTLASGFKLLKADESKDAEKARTQTGIVRAFGPAAFKNRNTLEPWPERQWCEVGWFIRTPMYGGDRVAVPVDPNKPNGDTALFLMIHDTDVLAVVTGDPLGIIAG